MISKKFIKSSFIYSVVGSLPLLSSVVLLPFYTNWLTTDQFGMLALYIALTAILQILVNFAIDHFLSVNWVNVKYHPQRMREHVGTSVMSLLIVAAVFIVLWVIAGFFLSGKYPDTTDDTGFEFYPWGFMCLLTAICNSMFKSYAALIIYQERPVRFFWISIFNFVLTITFSLVILYARPHSLMGPMWGRMLSGVGIFVLGLFFFIKEYGLAFQKKLVRELVVFSYPLLIYMLLLWFVGNADRYVIAYFLTNSDIAIFDFAVKCTMIIEVIQNGIQSSIYPKIFKIWKDGDLKGSTTEVNRYFNGFTALTLLAVPVIVILLPWGVPFLVTNTDFFLSFRFLALLFSAFAVSGIKAYFTAPILYFKKTAALPRAYGYSALIQIVLTVVLIKYFGIEGAVWAFLIVRFVQVLFLYVESKKIFAYRINLIKLLLLPAMYVALVVLCEILMIEDYRMYYEIGQFLVVAAVTLWVYRKEIVFTLKPLLERVGLRNKSKI